jgi:hypothetical protein
MCVSCVVCVVCVVSVVLQVTCGGEHMLAVWSCISGGELCSQVGTCVTGQCQCDPGFSGTYCQKNGTTSSDDTELALILVRTFLCFFSFQARTVL